MGKNTIASSRSNDRVTLIRDAGALVIVNDGAFRWVGDRDQVHAWLKDHDIDTRRPKMDSDLYQLLCDDTTCYVDTSGSYGPAGEDVFDLIAAIEEAGADTLSIE